MAVAPKTVGSSVKDALVSLLPKKKAAPGGVSFPNTYNPSATTSDLAIPAYRDHLSDIFSDRSAGDSRALMQQLMRTDPDVSAAFNAYLTMSDTDIWYVVKDAQGDISRPGHKALEQLLLALTVRFDYTKPSGFSFQKSLRGLCEEMRTMVLMRGGVGSELVLDKTGWPSELRTVDLATILWQEDVPDHFIPFQIPKNSSNRISMDIPTFFLSRFRQDPTSIYNYSPFISAINTIASRQQIINDLYRIMQMTGYPRIEVTLMEAVLRKNAPADAQTDATKMNAFLAARSAEIQSLVSSLRSDQAIVHYDSVKMDTMNKPGAMQLNIDSIIGTLNSQNQAALKVMGTIIGRGEAGVNTASVESRIFAMNSDQLNRPVSDILSQALTLALRLQGIDAIVEIGFENAEMRSPLEQQTNMGLKQNRWLQLLSLGIVDDDTFHLEMFNKIRPDSVPLLSGTHFVVGGTQIDTTASGDPAGQQPDALTRAETAPGGNAAAKDNKTKIVVKGK